MSKAYAVALAIWSSQLLTHPARATATSPISPNFPSYYILTSDERSTIAEQWRNSVAIYYTTQVKCPADNGGILDVVQRNDDGLVVRLRWQSKDGELRHIIQVARKGGWEHTEAYTDADLSTELRISKMKHAKKIYGIIIKQLCGPYATNADEWKNMIASNRKKYSGDF